MRAMNSSQGDPPEDRPDPPNGAVEEDPSRIKTSGRTSFDARGNAVWEFRTETGQFTSDASTTVVRKLEDSGLAIEATAIVKKPEQPAAKVEATRVGGFNPYDRGVVPKERPVAQRPATPTRAGAPRQTAAPRSVKHVRSIADRIRDALDGFLGRRR
jgi:hypothetical protein